MRNAGAIRAREIFYKDKKEWEKAMDLSQYLAKPEKTIREHNDDLMRELNCLWNLGYVPSERILGLVKMACKYHDYGKANPVFQRRVQSAGKIRFDETKEVAHNVLSLFFLPMDIFEDAADYYRVGQAVLNHHDYCDALSVLQDAEKKQLIRRLLEGFAGELREVRRRAIGQLKEVTNDQEAILIKGYLHKCDYCASAGVRVEYPNDFLLDRLEGLGYKWNDLQLFCKKNTDRNIIAIAQTGMGKTEGGLNWIGNEKGFFILPIRTAINAIYDRVRVDVLNNENIVERVALLHSGALEYYNDKKISEEMDVEDYLKRARQLSMPLTICTMDQLFDFVFKYNTYEMKLVTLSYAKIVLDEIQMYSSDLLAYLICGIKKISEFGGRVAIVTATLPPFIRDEIVGALGNDVEEGLFIDDDERHHVKVFPESLEAGAVSGLYRRNEEAGVSNKVLVVCNTVKKAQAVYRELSDAWEGEAEVNLLHSRLIRGHRAKKEGEILQFGKTFRGDGKDEIDHRSGIWVATSIVEASLDIDFDYLFTELSDLNALFQRFGRCNRKGVKGVEGPNCFVYTKVSMGGHLDETIFELSRQGLERVDGVITEKQKVELINRCFTRENVCRSEYYKNYKDIRDEIDNLATYEMDKSESRLRNILSTDVIPESVYIDPDNHMVDLVERLSSSQDAKERAKIRDEVRAFTVSIPSYIAIRRRDYVVRKVALGKYEEIAVFDCDYDEKYGFMERDYDSYKRGSNII